MGEISALPPASTPLAAPSIKRRLASLPYEGLVLVALIVIAAFPAAGLKGITLSGAPRIAFQIYIFAVVAVYFTWFWRHGGQTLAMKTWRFRLVKVNGSELSFARAFMRFLLALSFYGPACVGLVLLFFPERVSATLALWAFMPMVATILWARFDDDRQFLHDRMAGTRLVNVERR